MREEKKFLVNLENFKMYGKCVDICIKYAYKTKKYFEVLYLKLLKILESIVYNRFNKIKRNQTQTI
ncbi:hypothetical protein UT300019_04960 [Clostridium sp. CTA-19]